MTLKKHWVFVFLLPAAALIFWLWIGRKPIEPGDPDSAAGGEGEVPAAVARVERRNLGNVLTIAGEFKPFQDVEVHAKVAGYLRVIRVDVGDHVKKGETLAILEIPELTAELAGADAAVRRTREEIRRAQGNLSRAESAHGAAHSAFARLKQAAEARAGLVAQQEIDDSEARDLESEAQISTAKAELSAAQQELEVAQANQRQFNALSNYSRITAPFAGVITNRFADTGALIQAGTSSSTQAMPVVRLAEISKLRLVLPVPESVAAQIHLGDRVKVLVQALDQEIEGRVSRFSDSLDFETRTMKTEIDFDNSAGSLMPGMYTEARISLREKQNALTVPLQAVTRNGDQATVLALDASDRIEERPVKLGLEDAAGVEVLSGLTDQDRVVIGGRSRFRKGQRVRPREMTQPNPKSGGLK